jgi:pimeloyl-ACP methyl ester carboxylesterase
MREFLLRRMGDRPAVFVGQSMGGYGALLFAHLTERDSIAFVPQTLLTAHPLSKGIQPWKEKMHKIQQWTDYPQFLDLAFMRGLNHHIYYGVDHPEDRFYAERMGGVCLHPVKWDTHNVAKCLRERGIMKDILERKCISCQ